MRTCDRSRARGMPLGMTILLVALTVAADGWSREPGEPGPLRYLAPDQLHTILPPDTNVMTQPAAIERFLAELDGEPPDWPTVYGHGHHDPGHDDRLFALNRERDAKREGRTALSVPVAFVWSGSLSRYDPSIGGFPIALGPNFIKTSWGLVRFKPEEAPGNLSVVPDASHQSAFEHLLEHGQPVEIDVVMTGRLIPGESLVYDFSHEEEGLGLIMPFVRVEQVDFVLPAP